MPGRCPYEANRGGRPLRCLLSPVQPGRRWLGTGSPLGPFACEAIQPGNGTWGGNPLRSLSGRTVYCFDRRAPLQRRAACLCKRDINFARTVQFCQPARTFLQRSFRRCTIQRPYRLSLSARFKVERLRFAARKPSIAPAVRLLRKPTVVDRCEQL